MDQGAITLGQCVWACPSSSCVGPGSAFQILQADFARAMWLFEHQRRVQFEGCVAEPLYTLTAVLLAPKWSCLLLRIVLQDALSEVMKVYPPMKPKACVDDISAFMEVRNEESRGLVEKVGRAMRREVY